MKLNFLKRLRKKKDIAEVPFTDTPAVQSKQSLSKQEIHELDYSSVEAQKEVEATSGTATTEITDKESADYQFSPQSVELNLPQATDIAKKYLITHALLPNSIEPIKAMKRDAGGFYFEFKDRGVVHAVTLDEKGEVIEWEKRER